jgi:hypothetical protein
MIRLFIWLVADADLFWEKKYCLPVGSKRKVLVADKPNEHDGYF